MPFTLLLALAAAAQPAPAARACALIWPVAPDERAARRLAEAVIAADPHREGRNYGLRVRADEDNPGQWIAYQHLAEPRLRRPHRPGEVIVSAGGGGLEMRIDRCTGAISRLHYIR
jgi:hypothetical protein